MASQACSQYSDLTVIGQTSPSKAPKRQVQEEEAVDPIPWLYIRKYCTESAKMTYYAQQNSLKITQKRTADTQPVRATEAIRLARDAEEVIVVDKVRCMLGSPAQPNASQDGKVVHLENASGMTDARLKRALISSRHDALRAPSYRYGNKFVVGYSEKVNEEIVFGEPAAIDGRDRSKKSKQK